MNSNIGKRIKKLREHRNLSQRALSIYAGTSNATISRLENNNQLPNAKTLEKLASFLNVTTDFILTGIDQNKDNPIFIETKYKSDIHEKMHKIINKLNNKYLSKAEYFLESLIEIQEFKENNEK